MFTNGISASELTGAQWRKSRYSNSKGNCAELAPLGDGQIAMRQSTDPTGPALLLDRQGLAGFVTEAKAGGYDDLLV